MAITETIYLTREQALIEIRDEQITRWKQQGILCACGENCKASKSAVCDKCRAKLFGEC